MLVAVSGSGVEIVDAEGRVILDASGGAAVLMSAMGMPRRAAAMREQIEIIAHADTSFDEQKSLSAWLIG